MEKQKLNTAFGDANGISNSNSNSEIMEDINELMEIIDYDNSPIKTVRMEDKYFSAIGKYRLSEPTTNREEAIKDGERTDLNRICQIVECLINILNEKQS